MPGICKMVTHDLENKPTASKMRFSLLIQSESALFNAFLRFKNRCIYIRCLLLVDRNPLNRLMITGI